MMRPLIAAVLALGAVFAVQGWKAHIYAQGDAAGAARVQLRWVQTQPGAMPTLWPPTWPRSRCCARKRRSFNKKPKGLPMKPPNARRSCALPWLLLTLACAACTPLSPSSMPMLPPLQTCPVPARVPAPPPALMQPPPPESFLERAASDMQQWQQRLTSWGAK